jgi:NAD(P) transhydrogenase subunit beta
VRGNRIAAVGMAIAIVATLLYEQVGDWVLIVLGIVIGTAIGVPSALRVKMTAMPQMVALFNGVGGGAIALIAWAEFRERNGDLTELEFGIPLVFAAIVGSSPSGARTSPSPSCRSSSAASRSRSPAARSSTACCCSSRSPAASRSSPARTTSCCSSACSSPRHRRQHVRPADRRRGHARRHLDAQRVHRPERRRGRHGPGQHRADRRGHDRRRLGTILTQQMAEAMNRTIVSVLLGGFGGEAPAATGPAGATGGTVPLDVGGRRGDPDGLRAQVVVVPGYGMAVAQAQHAVRELAKALEAKGVEVKFGIHPVAGRMPGT